MSGKNQNSEFERWQNALLKLSEQALIDKGERLDALLLLRSPFGVNMGEDWLAPNELPLKDYPQKIIELLFNIAQKIHDWPMIKAIGELYNDLGANLGFSFDVSNEQSAQSLSLIPMQAHHMTDFFWQYSEDIAYFCKLPDFKSDDKYQQWQIWLADCNNQATGHLFAIYHQDWGFVGSICFDIYAGRGFFYYWIGEDFRGLSIGPDSVNLALAWAKKQHNLHCCYAVVFESNTPSQQALLKLGFKPVALKVDDSELYEDESLNGDEYEQELVYYLGEKRSAEFMCDDLNQLLVDIESQLRVVSS